MGALPSRDALLLAVCHELGNHLAAMRLATHALHDPPPPVELVKQLSTLSERAERWLNQLRWLVRDRDPDDTPVRDVLQRLAAWIEGRFGTSAPVDIDLGPAELVASGCSQLLFDELVFVLWEAAGMAPGSRLALGGVQDRVVLSITCPTLDAAPDPFTPEPATGTTLVMQIFARIWADRGVRFECARAPQGGAELRLCFP